jgi:F-type H+-transporting ATPase subunit delta
MSTPDIQTRPVSVMEDPSVTSVARVYAVALLDAAQQSGVAAALAEFRSFLDDVLTPQPAFERLLCAPVTVVEDKLRLIDRVVAPRGSELFVNFLRVLARHNRLDIVRAIAELATREHEVRSGQKRVQVTSATPLSEAARAAIAASLQPLISAQPILETAVDPKLVGGMVIRVGDTVYDGSVKNRLKQLRARLRERCMHEVQRGRDRFSHSAGN